jgi:protease-4
MRSLFLILPLALVPIAALAHHSAHRGVAVPHTGVATVDEPSAAVVNPAGIGFVESPALQYFHQGSNLRGSRLLGYSDGDGVYLAAPLLGLHPGISMEWMRPAGGQRYRRTGWSLALSGDQALSLGVTYNVFSSPDPQLDAFNTFDLGVLYRPMRFLSVGVAARDLGARLGGYELPVRYDFGLAGRLWKDRITVAADLYADSDAGGNFEARTLAAGLGVEPIAGLLIQAQYAFPAQAPRDDQAIFLTFTANTGHLGASAGAIHARTGGARGDGWIAGVRVSQERYRALPSRGGRVAMIDLGDALEEPGFFESLFSPRDPYAALLKRLGELRDDASVSALVVEVRDLPVGMGRTEELRSALKAIRDRGKRVVAYLVEADVKEYYLATAADTIWMPPTSAISVKGVATSHLYLKDGLAKIGVAFQAVTAGKYKSAPEQLTRSDMSAADKEQVGLILDDLYGRLVKATAEGRRLPEEKVRAAVDRGLYDAPSAKEAGLADALVWPDEIEGKLEALLGRSPRMVEDYQPAQARAAQRWGRRPEIAVVEVKGVIAPGKSRRDTFGVETVSGAETICRQIRSAASDPNVRAIVLRVDSPGGDVLASDLIWRELIAAKAKGKPVVASMGDLAASGGYFVSVAADTILAEPSTITGSIGVFGLKPDFSGLLGKIAVNSVVMKRGQNADIFSVTRPWNDTEKAAIQRQVDWYYDVFLTRVSEGRKMAKDQVDKLAGGHVWTGQQALERKLVDSLGDLSQAVQLAKQRSGLGPEAEVRVRRMGRGGGIFDLSEAESRLAGRNPLAGVARLLPEMRAAAALSELGPVVALPPGWVF